jgi:hypothetical protein
MVSMQRVILWQSQESTGERLATGLVSMADKLMQTLLILITINMQLMLQLRPFLVTWSILQIEQLEDISEVK